MRLAKTIALLLFLGTVVLFALQNLRVVTLSFLNWHLEIPLALASIIIYVFGAISGGIVFSMLKRLARDEKKMH
jgi:lipopolysaccharide assembly protein A